MHTVALPATVSMRTRRGTPVCNGDSWKSRIIALSVSSEGPTGAIAVMNLTGKHYNRQHFFPEPARNRLETVH